MRNLASSLFLLFSVIIAPLSSMAQADSIMPKDSMKPTFFKRVPYKELIVPAALMTYGIVALESHYLIGQNHHIKTEINEHSRGKFTADDFSQYAGTAATFGLEAFGVQPKHNIKQRLFTAAVAHAIMATTVYTIKNTGTVWRPDSSANNSFPSGHTATAFVGAELMWQEYKDQSIWYGVAGYAVAAGTGFFRMYNDKHWFSDVAMGAGIGILSTKIAYWLLPLVEDKLQTHKRNYVFMPGYNGRQATVAASLRF